MSRYRLVVLAAALLAPTLVPAAETPAEKKPGFLSRMFGRRAAAPVAKPAAPTTAAPAAAPKKADGKKKPTTATARTEKRPAGNPPRDAVARVQVFLDRQQFAPGKVDGAWSEFSRRAWDRWQRAQGLPPSDPFRNPPPTLSEQGETYASYAVTDADAKEIGTIPGSMTEQSKQKAMPYTTLAEMMAERFHTSPDFLRRINPGVDFAKLAPGTSFRAPNVAAFDLPALRAERKRATDEVIERRKAAAVQPGVSGPAPAASEPAPAASARYQLRVFEAEKFLEIYEAGKMVAAFPVTPGSATLPTPKGNWVVRSKVYFPEFRWDKSMLNTGKRSKEFHQIPPGPNNPVGVLWMGLSKDGIGLHGTNNPDTIGRAGSHGCVRLANWDAVRVAQFVEKGTKVTVE